MCGAVIALAALCWKSARSSELRLAVQFLAYTNIAGYGPVAVLQISNASSVPVVRDRSPEVIFDSPRARVEYAPTGFRVLEPGETELLTTEVLHDSIQWRFVVCAHRLGDEPYGIAAEPRFRVWRRHLAYWLQSHGLKVPVPSSPPGRVFSTDWIAP